MYKLLLADGSEISNLNRINTTTFMLQSNNPDIYWTLSDKNLAFTTLYNEDEFEDTFLDYTLTSFSSQAGVIRFRITPLEKEVIV